MKRIILVIVIGYIIGIIWGLYFKFSIALLYLGIFFIAILKKALSNIIKKFNSKHDKKTSIEHKNKLNLFSMSRYFRYFKLILNYKVLAVIILFSIVSNTIIIFKENSFNKLYDNLENIELIGIIENIVKDSNYKKTYRIKVISLNNSNKYNNTKLLLKTNSRYTYQCGDRVFIKGQFKKPDVARNYGGFSYRNYLKTQNVYGIVNASKIQKVKDRYAKNFIQDIVQNINIVINNFKRLIKEQTSKYLDNDVSSLYIALMFGDTSAMEESIKEQFKDSNLSHILAISGMHITYIILGVSIFFNRIVGKRTCKIILILVLTFYMFLANFSPSIVRACIMSIMILIGGIIHRKNDMWTSLSLSMLLILIGNPYNITNIGLQFSYLGTIGIVLFQKNILAFLNKGKENRSKIKEIISVSLSAQILILPISIYNYNTFGIYFLITNLIVAFVIGPIVIASFIFLIILIFNLKFLSFLSLIVNWALKILLLISRFSFLPFSKIYFRTPNEFEIITYFGVVFILNFVYFINHKKNKNSFHFRMKYLLETLKYKFREKKKTYIK